MVSKISNFIIFVTIVFTNGNPAYKQDYSEERQYDFKNWFESIVKRGNNDGLINEESPENNEDKTKTTYYSDKRNSRYYNENYRNADFYKDSSRNDDNVDRGAKDSFRCIGDRCYRNRNYNNPRDTLRCIGDRCGRNRDDDRNDREDDRNDRGDDRNDKEYDRNDRRDDRNDQEDDRDNRYDIRGDRYVRNKLRCVGDRCGKNRNYQVERENLFCIGDKCGRNKNDYKNRDTLRHIENRYINRLRCVGDRLGRNRDEHKKSCIRSGYDSEIPLTFNVSRTPAMNVIYIVKAIAKAGVLDNQKHNITVMEQNRSMVKNLRKGILELIKFHYGQERQPGERFFKKKS